MLLTQCTGTELNTHELYGDDKLICYGLKYILSYCQKPLRQDDQNSHICHSVSTLASVKKQQLICELLEENVIQPYVEEKSKFPETLKVTEGRQYRQRGLLHISDLSGTGEKTGETSQSTDS